MILLSPPPQLLLLCILSFLVFGVSSAAPPPALYQFSFDLPIETSYEIGSGEKLEFDFSAARKDNRVYQISLSEVDEQPEYARLCTVRSGQFLPAYSKIRELHRPSQSEGFAQINDFIVVEQQAIVVYILNSGRLFVKPIPQLHVESNLLVDHQVEAQPSTNEVINQLNETRYSGNNNNRYNIAFINATQTLLVYEVSQTTDDQLSDHRQRLLSLNLTDVLLQAPSISNNVDPPKKVLLSDERYHPINPSTTFNVTSTEITGFPLQNEGELIVKMISIPRTTTVLFVSQDDSREGQLIGYRFPSENSEISFEEVLRFPGVIDVCLITSKVIVMLSSSQVSFAVRGSDSSSSSSSSSRMSYKLSSAVIPITDGQMIACTAQKPSRVIVSTSSQKIVEYLIDLKNLSLPTFIESTSIQLSTQKIGYLSVEAGYLFVSSLGQNGNFFTPSGVAGAVTNNTRIHQTHVESGSHTMVVKFLEQYKVFVWLVDGSRLETTPYSYQKEILVCSAEDAGSWVRKMKTLYKYNITVVQETCEEKARYLYDIKRGGTAAVVEGEGGVNNLERSQGICVSEGSVSISVDLSEVYEEDIEIVLFVLGLVVVILLCGFSTYKYQKIQQMLALQRIIAEEQNTGVYLKQEEEAEEESQWQSQKSKTRRIKLQYAPIPIAEDPNESVDTTTSLS